jgi:hypothetical protein
MRIFEKIEAWGHPNVSANNRTTFEVTKEDRLTRRGDCIIAINASKGARDLNDEFKQFARQGNAKITLIIEAGQYREMANGRGDLRLTLSHPTDLVVRKSSYICDRTLMIEADKAAIDFSRDLVKKFQEPSQKVIITLIVEVQ